MDAVSELYRRIAENVPDGVNLKHQPEITRIPGTSATSKGLIEISGASGEERVFIGVSDYGSEESLTFLSYIGNPESMRRTIDAMRLQSTPQNPGEIIFASFGSQLARASEDSVHLTHTISEERSTRLDHVLLKLMRSYEQAAES